MLAPYRRILTIPGALAFSMTGLVARFPISMTGLGMVLLVEARTGSYGLAGAVSACAGVAGAVGSPVQGRLADRVGQARVLLGAATVFATGLAVVLTAVETDRVVPLAFVGAVLAGGGLPQAGAMVRTRWRHVAPDRPTMQTGFAFEAVVDEVVFIVGPVVVVALATGVDPAVALVLAGGLGVVGAAVLSAQRATSPPVRLQSDVDARPRRPLGWTMLLPVVLASVGLGTVFGSTEVVTVAFTDDLGRPGAAGVLLAIWAAGSLVAGVLVGSVGSGWAPHRMFRIATLALGLSFVPMLFVASVPLAALVLLASGLAISPSLVASISLVERLVPSDRLTEGIGWATTGLAGGVALGAAASGAVVDAAGPNAAYAVPLAAGALAAAMAWAIRPRVVAP
ncbi:MFS transporter [Solicola sp. PLA-1-18]|uniref:MFS transporter n=1 Tax=Solicola sp. PLA-1-18 TaxID=3380532 RepID=UPI003B7C7544